MADTLQNRLQARLEKHQTELVALGQISQQIAGSVNEINYSLEHDADVLSDEEKAVYKQRIEKLKQEYTENNAKRNDILGRIRIVEEMLAVEGE